MKKVLLIILLFSSILFSGCGNKNDAANAAGEYLNKYKNHDSVILNQIDTLASSEDIPSNKIDVYKDILKRQYKDLTYEMVEEMYDGDDATVTVKVTVYDLYKIQKDALAYMELNPQEFVDENGEYDNSKFFDYKLDKMQDIDLQVTYTVDLFLTKDNKEWKVTQPSNVVLEKIHGIYNYDNR